MAGLSPFNQMTFGLVRAAEKLLPSNVGAFVGTLTGNRQPITEHTLPAQDINALRRAAADAMMLGMKRGHDTLMGYPNYPGSHEDVDNPGWWNALKQTLTEPGYRMKTTIGAARLRPDAKGNMHVIDTYDFNRDGPGAELVRNPNQIRSALKQPTKVLDALGYMAAPDNAPNRRPVDINLGFVKPAYLGQTAR